MAAEHQAGWAVSEPFPRNTHVTAVASPGGSEIAPLRGSSACNSGRPRVHGEDGDTASLKPKEQILHKACPVSRTGSFPGPVTLTPGSWGGLGLQGPLTHLRWGCPGGSAWRGRVWLVGRPLPRCPLGLSGRQVENEEGRALCNPPTPLPATHTQWFLWERLADLSWGHLG